MDANKNRDNANDLWINNLKWNEMEIRYRICVKAQSSDICLARSCCLYLRSASAISFLSFSVRQLRVDVVGGLAFDISVTACLVKMLSWLKANGAILLVRQQLMTSSRRGWSRRCEAESRSLVSLSRIDCACYHRRNPEAWGNSFFFDYRCSDVNKKKISL